MRRIAPLVVWVLLGASCGASRPRRFVIEHEIDHYAYRRYQRVLDVELPIEGNSSVGHTAVYVRPRGRARPGIIGVAFVTVYGRGRGLAQALAARMRNLPGYRVRMGEIGGEDVWLLRGSDGDAWAVWVSGSMIVKVGAPEGPEVSEDLAEAYLDLYPSELDEHGRRP